jgi:REP element-mobilizing transposase RayT
MKCISGEIVNEEMKLNDYGKIVSECLKKIPMIHNNLELDYHVIMPNHIHAIIIVGDAKFASPTLSKIKVVTENDALTDRTKMVLSKIIQQFKRKCTLEIRNMGFKNFKWQRSFYDRIIRNEKELFNIRKYIEQNPSKWEIDKYSVQNLEF